MTDIFVGSVAVGVVPDARGWEAALRAQLVPSSNAIGQQVGSNVAQGVVNGLAQKKPDMTKKGDESGGAFGDAFSKRLKASLDALPKAKLDADPTAADRKVDELRQRMEDLSKKEIGINMTSKEATAELDKINTELDKVKFKAGDIALRFNTVEARAQLDALSRDISSKTGGSQGGVLGLLNKIPGVNLGGAGGAAGSIGGTGGQAAGAAASGGGGLLTNPYVLGGGAALGAAAAPFAGQALGGTLIAGLGGALAGLGVLGALYGNVSKTATVSSAQMTAANQRLSASQSRVTAAEDNLQKLQASGKATAAQLASAHASVQSALASETTSQAALGNLQKQQLTQNLPEQTQKMKTAFKDLGTDAKKSLAEIGAAFVPVMTSIFNTADSVMKRMTPVFAGAERIISGPFQLFTDTFLKAFTSPAVTKSINDVAKAFSSILTAFTPDLPGIFNSFAEAISRVASAISKNPKAFADFLNFLFQLVIALVDAIAWLTVAANYIEFHFMPAIQHFIRFWQDVWRDFAGAVAAAVRFVVRILEDFWHVVTAVFDVGAAIVRGIWNVLWSALRAVVTIQFALMRFIIKTTLDIIFGIFLVFINLLTGHWGKAWDVIRSVASLVLQNFRQFLTTTMNAVSQFWASKLETMRNAAVDVWHFMEALWKGSLDFLHTATVDSMNAVKNAFTDVINWLQGFFAGGWRNLFTTILPNAVKASVSAIGAFWNGVKDVVRAPIAWITDNVIDGLIRVFNNVINAIGLGKFKIGEVHPFGLAAGGRITAGTHSTADDVLVRVSRDETVVSAADSKVLAPAFAAMGIPGYAGGGLIGSIFGGAKHIASSAVHAAGDVGAAVAHGVSGAVSKAIDVTKIVAALVTGNTQALVNAFGNLTGMHYPGALLGDVSRIATAMPKFIVDKLVQVIKDNFTSGGASANAVLAYAESFLGKVPYVWGGDTPAGWDCSGFVSYVLEHFNLLKGRLVAEGLRQWAKPTPPTPGAMAFYGNPAHHVGFVKDANTLLSALHTGTMTVYSGLNMGDNSGYGVPPQGYGSLAGGAIHYNPSGGVMQWNTAVLQALALNGLAAYLASQVEYQMQTESGGNPNAINNWDINAQHGDPSKGLLQVIGSTFAAYHVPGTSSNIFDPLANIAAAINYAKHTYGPTLMSGGMGMGSGHGYDEGGWWPPGTFGWNTSGQHEYVLTHEQLRGALTGQGGYHAHFDGLTMQAIESHVRSAFQAMSLQQGNMQRQGRRR